MMYQLCCVSAITKTANSYEVSKALQDEIMADRIEIIDCFSEDQIDDYKQYEKDLSVAVANGYENKRYWIEEIDE